MAGQGSFAPADRNRSPPTHSPLRSLVLHLAPGLAIFATYILLAPVVVGAGYPGLVALLLAVPLVLVPLELGIPYLATRRTNQSLAEIIPYRASLRLGTYGLFSAIAFLWALAASALLAPLDAWLLTTAFDWVPATLRLTGEPLDLSGSRLVITFALGFLFNGLVGPAVEEIYSQSRPSVSGSRPEGDGRTLG